ncbi:MAG: PfkB family carbohydrate kinase [Microbacteriaceae bacterium]
MKPVLVIGEALIDIVERSGEEPLEHVGGSPANVALGLGRLGIPVRLRTALARDSRGERIAAHLAASGVALDEASFALDRTSTAIARIDESGDAAYEFDISWRLDEPVTLGETDVIHVGSIGCFIEPGATSIIGIFGARGANTRITFDPNIRPALVGSHESALARTEQLAGESDVVKLSDEDAAWLYPGAGVDWVLDRLLALGARVAAVTLGGEGAILASSGARVRIEPRRIEPRDTLGAGDTFMASLVASVATGMLGDDAPSLLAAGETAALAAAITVSRAGADLPTAAELAAAR